MQHSQFKQLINHEMARLESLIAHSSLPVHDQHAYHYSNASRQATLLARQRKAVSPFVSLMFRFMILL